MLLVIHVTAFNFWHIQILNVVQLADHIAVVTRSGFLQLRQLRSIRQ